MFRSTDGGLTLEGWTNPAEPLMGFPPHVPSTQMGDTRGWRRTRGHSIEAPMSSAAGTGVAVIQ